jgi:phosphoserine phosphatase
MAKLLLIRHGHVEGIDPPRFRGRTDVSLTPEGLEQGRLVARFIFERWRPSVVYTSPMKRCVETARPIATLFGIEAVVLPELTDLHYGAWQWRTHDEVRAQYPGLFHAWFRAPHMVRFPEGDSLQDLVARVADAMRLVLARHPADTVVLVGHDSGIRALLVQLLDQPLSAYWRLAQSPAGISEVDINRESATIIRINETQHLARSSSR